WEKGIGRALLSASLDQVRKCKFDQITLWVLEGNQRARSFYESFGFIHDGAMKDDDDGKVLPSVTFVIVLTCRRSNEAFQTDALRSYRCFRAAAERQLR